jgi:hypothetical protein
MAFIGKHNGISHRKWQAFQADGCDVAAGVDGRFDPLSPLPLDSSSQTAASSGEGAVIVLWHGAQELEERHRRHLPDERSSQDTSRFLLGGDTFRRRFGAQFAHDRFVQLSNQDLRHLTMLLMLSP